MNDNLKKLHNASLLLNDLIRCEQWSEVARVAGEMKVLAERLQQDEYAQEARQILHPLFAQIMAPWTKHIPHEFK